MYQDLLVDLQITIVFSCDFFFVRGGQKGVFDLVSTLVNLNS